MIWLCEWNIDNIELYDLIVYVNLMKKEEYGWVFGWERVEFLYIFVLYLFYFL